MIAITTAEQLAWRSSTQKNLTLAFSDGTILDNSNILTESMDIEQTISEGGELFGAVFSSCFRVAVFDTGKRFAGMSVNPSISVETEEEETYTRVLGGYTVFSDKLTADGITRELLCYDSLYPVLSEDYSSWHNSLTFPMTVKAYRDAFFTHIGITQESATLLNDSMTINAKNISTTSGAGILSAILSINVAWGYIGFDGNFKYVSPKTTADVVIADNSFLQGSLAFEEYETTEYNGVGFKQSTTVTRTDSESGEDYEEEVEQNVTVGTGTGSTLIFQDHIFLSGKTDAQLTTIGNSIINALSGFTYTPSVVEFPVYMGLELGDLFSIETEKKTVTFPVLGRKLSGISRLIDAFTANGVEYASANANSTGTLLSSVANSTNTVASMAKTAQQLAGNAQKSANDASNAAQAARTAAGNAQTSANNAATAASNAQASATSANVSANSALTQLGIVEDVLDTLNWISEHGTYKASTDTEVVPGKYYFTRSGTSPDYTYTVVANPTGNPSSNGYYELDSVDEAVSNYISTHLALTDDGLYVLMDNSGYKLKLTSTGAYILNTAGTAVATYSTTTTIGNASTQNVYIDNDSVDIRNGNSTLASFGAVTTIGDVASKSHFEIRSNKITGYDSGGYQYFAVGDLRGTTYTQRYTGDGSTNRFFVYYPVTLTVTVDGVDVTDTITAGGVGYNYFYLETAPADGASIVVTSLLPINRAASYFTYGSRISGSVVGINSFTAGSYCEASGMYSQAVGLYTEASGNYTHAEGSSTEASYYCSHAEGYNTTASGLSSHAEGSDTTASGSYSHAEGSDTTASGSYSHAEGFSTTASGRYAHAEGASTEASGNFSHAEGSDTTASGYFSHAEGSFTEASNYYSHAQNLRTIANGYSQTAIGKYNVADTTSAFIIGNGTSDSARSNALTVDWDGNVTSGDITITSSGTIAQNIPAQLFLKPIQTNNNIGSTAVIKAYDDHDATNAGTNLVIQGGSNTIIGGGESADTLYTNELTNSTSERLFLTADSNIEFHTNVGNYDSKKSAILNSSLVFYPSVAGTGDIGSASYPWNIVTANYLNAKTALSFDTTPSADSYERGFHIKTSDDKTWGYMRAVKFTTGDQGMQIEAHRIINNTDYYSGIRTLITSTGEAYILSNANFMMNTASKGYFLKDSTNTDFPGLYHNADNLWIGAKAVAGRHHVGATFISTGYDSSTSAGKPTIYVCVPNASNNSGTTYGIYHEGYKPTPAAIGAFASTGGTITGDVTITKSTSISANNSASLFFQVVQTDNNITNSSAYIRVYDDHDAQNYGTNMVIQSYGNVIIGGGESPGALYTNVIKGTSNDTAEMLCLTADNGIHFYTNCNTIANRVETVLDGSGYFYPNTAKTGAVGTTSNPFGSMHTATMHMWQGDASVHTTIDDTAIPSANNYSHGFHIKSSNDINIGHLRGYKKTNDYQGLNIEAVRAISGTNKYNTLNLAVDASGNPVVEVNNSAAWRNALGASSGVWPLSLGGSGQGSTTTGSTIATLITVNSTNATITSVAYAVWGKVVLMHIVWTNKNAISVPANGNITNVEVGTLTTNYRPAIFTAAHSNGDTAGAAHYNIAASGVIQLGAVEATGAARTIAAETTFSMDAVFIKA